MPTPVTSGTSGTNTLQPIDSGIIPTNPVVLPDSAVVKPGYDAQNQPLGDAEVWNLFVDGKKNRPVNTAAMQGKKSIDNAEAKALLELAQKDPREFASRLLADSSNGTPVHVNYAKEIKGFGIARVDFKCDNGHMTTTATFEVFNKTVDGWLKPYMAKDAREKGKRSTITLEVKGDLNDKQGIDNISASITAAHLPALSAEKLMELDKVKGQVKDALEGTGTPAEKGEKVQSLVRDALRRMSDIPVGFFVGLIRDSSHLEIDVKERDHALKGHAETGDGKLALTFTDLLDSANKEEADLGAKVDASVADDKDTIKVDDISVFTTDKLAIEIDQDNKPVLSKINADGTKSKVDDHVSEIFMYLPLVLEYANKGGSIG